MPDIYDDHTDRPGLAKAWRCSERTIARYENQPDGLPSLTLAGRKYYNLKKAWEWLAKREHMPNPRRRAA